MKITRTRSYKINMGNYESLELSATVSVEDVDIYDEDEMPSDPDKVWAGIKEHAERYLEHALGDELAEAAKTSAADASMLFDQTPPRRTERARSRR